MSADAFFPFRTKSHRGHRYSKKSLEFLDRPETTREHVVISLGPPLIEDKDSRVLLYTWEITKRYRWFIPRIEFGDVSIQSEGDTEELPPERQGLFIAYDEEGFIVAHEERYIGTSGYREQITKWRLEFNE